MARIEWTSEILAMTPFWRGDGPPLVAPAVDGAELFATARATGYRGISEAVRAILKTGEVGTKATEAIVGPLAYAGRARGQSSPSDEELQRLTFALIDRWVAAFGAAGAFEIFTSLVHPQKPHYFESSAFVEDAATRLRQHLAHAPDYDAALAKAKALMKSFPVGKEPAASNDTFRTRPFPEVVAFLFPDHRPFFAAAEAHGRALTWTFTLLVGAVADEHELERIWEMANGNRWALNIVRRIGERALPLLAQYPYVSRGIVAALSVFPEPAAAKAMVRHLEKPEPRADVAAYFERYPELASKALAQPGKLSASGANAARRILAAAAKPKKEKKTVTGAHVARAGAYLGEVASAGSSISVIAMDAERSRGWDARANDGSSAALMEDLTGSGQGLQLVLQVPCAPVFETATGLALLEHYPPSSREPAPERLSVHATTTKAKGKKPRSRGTVHVRSGALALVQEHGSATDLDAESIRAAAGAAKATTIDDVVLVPLANGVYEVFEETLDADDALGLVETRVRFERTGAAPAGVAATAKPARAIALDPSGATATSLGTIKVQERVMVLLDDDGARAWDGAEDLERAIDVFPGGSLKVGKHRAVVIDLGPVDATHAWQCDDGLRLLEYYPAKGTKADAADTVAKLARYVAQIPATAGAKKLGTLAVKGCLVVQVPHAVIPPRELDQLPTRTARIVRYRKGFPHGMLVPLAPGVYDVFAERMGGKGALTTEIGRLDRRIRISRQGSARTAAANGKTSAKDKARTKSGTPRRFELVEGTSRKFWEIALTGSAFTVRFGRLGTDGQSLAKKWPSADAAKKEHDKLIAEKTRKGYREA